MSNFDVGFCFILFFLCVLLLSLRSLFISNERQKGSGLDGNGGREGLGGVEGEETVIRIYYVRKDVEAQKCESISTLSDNQRVWRMLKIVDNNCSYTSCFRMWLLGSFDIKMAHTSRSIPP